MRTAIRRRIRSAAAAIAAVALAAGAASGVALPASAEPTSAPTPDVLDVDFASGAPVEHVQQLAPTAIGSPGYESDATIGATVATFGGSAGVRFPADTLWSTSNPKNILESVTLRCELRYDGPSPATSTNAFCSGRQTGGYSIDITKDGLRFVVAGSVVITHPVASGTWYDVVATWDGTDAALYLDGVLVGTGTKAGGNTTPAAQFWFVGADTKAAGAGESFATGAVARSSIWSTPLTAEQVLAVHEGRVGPQPATVPDADVLDVDFADGTATDAAANRPATVIGAPVYSTDPALDRTVASFNGASGIRYPLSEPWDSGSATDITTTVTIECAFRFDGTLPTATNNAMCSGRQGGGYTIDVSGGNIRFVIGSTVAVTAPARTGLWYDAVATYDGTTAKLYLSGSLAGESAKTGATAPPSYRYWVIGADVGTNANLEFYGAGTVAAARIWSGVLDADQVHALSVTTLGDRDSGVALTASVPAADASLAKPVRFSATIENQGAASGWSYLLDGGPIQPGQLIGAGMRAGAHEIVITATDLFGAPIEYRIPFTSSSIPIGGGTDTGQGHGTVSLSAAATDPDGGQVTTTFERAMASVASGGFQGIVPVVPSALEFPYTDGSALTGEQVADGDTTGSVASHDEIPFQRFDVTVPASGDDRRVQWSGTVDPERTATVRAWSVEKDAWVELASTRGTSGGDTVLVGDLSEALVDASSGTPLVHVLVAVEDPFADDLAPRDASAGTAALKDHFEDPGDYDFSIVHWTDPQYVTEGATGGAGQWPASVSYPTSSGVETPEEQAIWASAYRDAVDWTVDNAAPRKIAFVANSGDLINNDYYNPEATASDGSLLYPGLEGQVQKEFSFASGALGPLADSGIPNQVIAGNHDNQLGVEDGAASRFSEAFTADDWYAQAAGWPAGADYHAWDETTDATGHVVSPGHDNQNSYVLFSAGGLDFVVVGLSYGVTQQEVDWANSVFARYHDRNGILMTHGYLTYSTNPDGRGAALADDGNLLYDKVVSTNPNIVLVLAGHRHGSGINLKSIATTDSTHKVVELLSDYQAYTVPASTIFTPGSCPSCVFGTNGSIDVDGDGVVDHKPEDKLVLGSSFLRLLQVDIAKSTLSVDSYSPVLDRFGPTIYDPLSRYNGAEENFTVPIDLTSRTTSFSTDALTVVTPTTTVIGTATARSGWPATVTWSGLTRGTTYAWTATSRNAAGEDLGDVEQYGGVFVATAAGSDTTAPVLTLPADTTVPQDEPFDALAGVTATDDSDGDVTASVQVAGAVDTATPGSYTLVYSASDANGNVAQASRTVRVRATPVPDLDVTTVSVPRSTATFGTPAVLTASVSPAGATGFVQFSNGEDVLCQATVTDGTASCTVDILPPPGEYAAEAAYSGDDTRAESRTSFVLAVTDPTLPASLGIGIAAAPSIAGVPTVGSTLVATPGAFTGDPTDVAGQWLLDGSAIPGATGATLGVDAAWVGGVIGYRSVASKSGTTGTVTATSAPLAPVSQSATSVTAAASPARYGTSTPVSVAVARPAGVAALTGSVTLSGAGVSRTVPVGTGTVTIALPRTVKPGSYAVSIGYAGDPAVGSSSTSIALIVAAAKAHAPKLSVTKKPTVRKTGRATVRIAAAAGLAAASGRVTVTLVSGAHTKKVRATLAKGRASVTLPKLARGTWRVKAVYAGSGYYAPSTSATSKVVVRR
ncbi:Ig-like domain repeat protein [Galbitalea sp. SE-J8]|uniref:LamG-like jellyroll fold domain-containing protein n=1 Tax=Galbitalea sp. SE-J8 TaxID=3054952 RepID=UPI00259CA244|nr:LamG-like jellyroll fold domain-containing protein [Galbitalea sp. SE-J8]MDM4762276.1 Ig-like domain repeat protein [Galbitalea sp. SE-J8]